MFVETREVQLNGRRYTDCIINTDKIIYITPNDGGYDIIYAMEGETVHKIHTDQRGFDEICDAIHIARTTLTTSMN